MGIKAWLGLDVSPTLPVSADTFHPPIALIFSFTKNAKVVEEKINHLINKKNVQLLHQEKIHESKLHLALEKAALTNTPTIIFMSAWQESIFLSKYQGRMKSYLFIDETSVATQSERYGWREQVALLREKFIRMDAVILQSHANTKMHPDILTLNEIHMHHHIRVDEEADVKRLIRYMTGNAFAMVLGGGGAKGLLHLGVLKALVEKKIPIDAIGGTSVGANIAACYALTRDYDMTRNHVFTLRNATKEALSFKHMTLPLISLYSSHPITVEIMNIFGETNIEDLLIPYFAISTNTMSDVEHIHRTGCLWQATRSSGAIPGIFPPVVCEGNLLFDGGIMNNLPVDVMRNMIGDGHTIMAVSLSKKIKNKINYNFPPVLTLKNSILSKLRLANKDFIYPPFIETITEALLLGSAGIERANEKKADILIKPDLTKFKSLHILENDSSELIELGYQEGIIAIENFLKSSPHFRDYL